MSPEEEEDLLGRVMFEKLGFRIGDFVQAFRPRTDRLWHRYEEPDGLRYVVGIADPPHCDLLWVKYVRNGRPYGRRHREYGTRLKALEGGALVQMTFQVPKKQRPT